MNKLPLVLDTNILVSAALWRGNEHRLLALGIEKSFEGLTCEFILTELERVLHRIDLEDAQIREWRSQVAATLTSIPVKPQEAEKAESFLSDKNDAAVLALALKAEAALVTGDKNLRKGARRAGVQAIRTVEALEMVGDD